MGKVSNVNKKEYAIIIVIVLMYSTVINLPITIGLWLTNSFTLGSIVIMTMLYLISSIGLWVVISRELK